MEKVRSVQKSNPFDEGGVLHDHFEFEGEGAKAESAETGRKSPLEWAKEVQKSNPFSDGGFFDQVLDIPAGGHRVRSSRERKRGMDRAQGGGLNRVFGTSGKTDRTSSSDESKSIVERAKDVQKRNPFSDGGVFEEVMSATAGRDKVQRKGLIDVARDAQKSNPWSDGGIFDEVLGLRASEPGISSSHGGKGLVDGAVDMQKTQPLSEGGVFDKAIRAGSERAEAHSSHQSKDIIDVAKAVQKSNPFSEGGVFDQIFEDERQGKKGQSSVKRGGRSGALERVLRVPAAGDVGRRSSPGRRGIMDWARSLQKSNPFAEGGAFDDLLGAPARRKKGILDMARDMQKGSPLDEGGKFDQVLGVQVGGDGAARWSEKRGILDLARAMQKSNPFSEGGIFDFKAKEERRARREGGLGVSGGALQRKRARQRPYAFSESLDAVLDAVLLRPIIGEPSAHEEAVEVSTVRRQPAVYSDSVDAVLEDILLRPIGGKSQASSNGGSSEKASDEASAEATTGENGRYSEDEALDDMEFRPDGESADADADADSDLDIFEAAPSFHEAALESALKILASPAGQNLEEKRSAARQIFSSLPALLSEGGDMRKDSQYWETLGKELLEICSRPSNIEGFTSDLEGEVFQKEIDGVIKASINEAPDEDPEEVETAEEYPDVKAASATMLALIGDKVSHSTFRKMVWTLAQQDHEALQVVAKDLIPDSPEFTPLRELVKVCSRLLEDTSAGLRNVKDDISRLTDNQETPTTTPLPSPTPTQA